MPEQAGGSGLPVARPPVDRRRRREAVEMALLAGERGYGPLLARDHGVSLRVIRSDARAILARWARDDRRRLDQRRALIIARAEGIYGAALSTGDAGLALRALLVLARLLGVEGTGQDGRARIVLRFSGSHDTPAALQEPEG